MVSHAAAATSELTKNSTKSFSAIELLFIFYGTRKFAFKHAAAAAAAAIAYVIYNLRRILCCHYIEIPEFGAG